MTREEFERDFNSRTLAYCGTLANDPRELALAIGHQGHNPTGHALISTIANLVARAHRNLVFVGDLDQPLLCRDPLGATTLHDATVGRALAINPHITTRVTSEIPASNVLISIGVGRDAELRVGAHGWCATFGNYANPDPARTSLLGAALAAPLAAAAAFHRQTGYTTPPTNSFSLWEGGRQSEVQGPLLGQPLDVGRVLQAGAGAVGCALDFWLAVLGVEGDWTIADADVVDATNLNRQMLFAAVDAGYPTGAATNKASIAADAIGPTAHAEPRWVHEIPDIASARYDLILPLANEHGVRVFLQSRPEPVLLHATTTPSYGATVHRHIAGHDGCIVCRLPIDHDAVFACSTGTVKHPTESVDASLPFLSAAAGALLLAEIIRLQHGELKSRPTNYAILDMATPRPTARSYPWPGCSSGCRISIPGAARTRLNRGTRWASLDGAAP